MTYPATLLMNQFVTHDTRRLLLTRPDALDWAPGQGIELAIDEPRWREQGRPFTPTSLREDRILELTVKRYPEEANAVTVALHELEPGADLQVSDAFGAITYQGRGTFIAAGAGVTPFLAILRRLVKDGRADGHRLLLSNKEQRDVICEPELRHALGGELILTFTREHDPSDQGRHIDAAFLDANIGARDGYFYVCGPDGFVASVSDDLLSLGIHPEQLVHER